LIETRLGRHQEKGQAEPARESHDISQDLGSVMIGNPSQKGRGDLRELAHHVDIEQGRCLFRTNWGVVGGDKIVGAFRSKGTIVFELKCHEKEQFQGLKGK
jgi:2,3-bisphosphoglycerate-independent phosphoglycerate mutase